MRTQALFVLIMSVSLLGARERGALPNDLPLLEPGQTPEEKAMELKKKHCIPCEGKTKPLTDEEENDYAKAIPKWEIKRNGTHKLARQFLFKDFKEAMHFINEVATIAEEENHHPNLSLFFNRVIIELYTHAITGLSENDFIVAAHIDEAARKRPRSHKK